MKPYNFRYEKLGDYTYTLLPEGEIKGFLLEWLIPEWKIDHAQFPDQPWTSEWLKLLPEMSFTLHELAIEDISLREDLMSYNTSQDNFAESLRERAVERKTSVLRGVSTEPVVVNACNNELMDGYTRYCVLQSLNQKSLYAYVGTINTNYD